MVLTLIGSGHGRRLLLGEDGFARVDGETSAVPATGITVSSWVNITEFPGGVAPIVTIISADATYQIAFFVRHDGAGVLWGGPASTESKQETFVDRHPRSRFHTKRRRRDAVDYSMGLGDVMNIMGPRKERSNTWTPMNFVDVSEMGVADLETSGSSTSNHYENWYDVGYELQMQESANPEPKILTKPSGENDFVVINWEGNNVPPLSSNQWDPVNDELDIPEIVLPKLPTKIRAPNNERFVWSQEDKKTDEGWSSQVLPINMDSSVSDNKAYVVRQPANPTSATSTLKQNKQVTRSRPARPFVPDLRRPITGDKVRRPIADKFRYNVKDRENVPAATVTPTTKRQFTASNEEVKKPENRVPLWARLKKTSGENKMNEESLVTELPPPRVRPATRKSPIQSKITKSYGPTSTSPAPRVTTRLPVTSTRRPEVIRRKTIQGTTTTKPYISKLKAAQRLRANQNKERKHHTSSSASKNNFPKRPFSPARASNKPMHSHSLDEFKRVFEGKSTIKDDGDKVVVYSMPITDVDAFNRMYEHYQEMESRHSPRINLHAVYQQARDGDEVPTINEDENNQNRLEQIPEPLPVLTYKEEPLHYAELEKASHSNITPVIIETVIEEAIPSYDQSSFIPLQIQDPYKTLERDYSAYYPYVQKVDPIIISPSRDQIAQSAERHLSLNIPLLSAAGALPGFANIPLAYEPAVLAQQDISGQQAGFYQEPSRISHEQLPPEYTRKPQTENKKMSASKHSNNINNQDFRSQQNMRPVQQYNDNNEEQIYSSPEIIRQQMLAQALSQSLNTERVRSDESEQATKPVITEKMKVVPEKIESIPVEIVNTPDVLQEVPLNVNFRKMPYNFDHNTWYHITFTWSSQDHVLRIYVNGQLAGVLEDTIPDKKILPTSGMMLLGKTLLPSLTGFDPTSHLTGEMSNFVVWNDSLSAEEVNNVFTCGPSPTHPILLAWNTTPLRVYNDATVEIAPPICGISS